MIEEGFQNPLIQHVIHDPSGGGKWYRVDFIWFLPDGRIIVAEYDGMAKYTDPMMTDRKNIQTIVNEQRDREQSLCSWGVTKIVRLYYEDAVNRTGLVSKLCQAGVPYECNPVCHRRSSDRGLIHLHSKCIGFVRESFSVAGFWGNKPVLYGHSSRCGAWGTVAG